jgi:transposase
VLWCRWGASLKLDHPARLIDDFVDRLDQTALNQCYAGVGSLAHRPDLVLKIVLYEILEGRLLPAQWQRDIPINDALRWLGQGIQPSRSALYNFRDRMDSAVLALHAAAIRQAMAEGFTTAEHGVLDGTSIRASASRHHLAHEEKLRKRLEALSTAVESDAASRPVESRPYWMATTPLGRQRQLQRYRRAEIQLADRLARNQERPKDKRLPCKQVRVSLSDPEAPLGRDKEKVFCPLYTAQFVVAPDSLLILSFDVFAQPTDAGTLPPMLDRTTVVTGRMLDQIDTDAGYCSVLDLQECQARGVQLVAPVQENDFTVCKRAKAENTQIGKDQFQWLPEEQTYACPKGHRLNFKGCERKRRRDDQTVIQRRYHCPAEHCRSCPLRTSCVRNPEKGRTVKRLEGEELIEAHKAFMITPEAKEAKRLRGSVIERSFGDAKQHRHLRRLHGRGLGRARAEIGLVVLAQTALTLERLRQKAATPGENKA